jgi:hypothetical protein
VAEFPVASVDPGRVDGNDNVIHDLWLDVGADPTEYVHQLRLLGLIGPPPYWHAIQLPSVIPNPLPVVYTT